MPPGDWTPRGEEGRKPCEGRRPGEGWVNLRLGSYLNGLGDGRFYSIGPQPPALG